MSTPLTPRSSPTLHEFPCDLDRKPPSKDPKKRTDGVDVSETVVNGKGESPDLQGPFPFTSFLSGLTPRIRPRGRPKGYGDSRLPGHYDPPTHLLMCTRESGVTLDGTDRVPSRCRVRSRTPYAPLTPTGRSRVTVGASSLSPCT